MGNNGYMLSIIIPMWNRSKTICYCLDSILSQALAFPFEIIVVDDASTDDSCSIVEEIVGGTPLIRLCDSRLAKDMPRTVSFFEKINFEEECAVRSIIRLLCLDNNSGAATARNIGLNNAKGDFVWFVDSDDIIAQGSLRILKPIITSCYYDILCFSTKKYSSVPEAFVIEHDTPSLVELDCSHSDSLLYALRSGTVWSRIYNRKFIENLNDHIPYRFNQKYAYSEDSQFVWLTTLNANKMAYMKDTLYGYMDNPNSLTSVKPIERFVCYIKVIEEYLTIIHSSTKTPNCKNFLVEECEKRLYTHAFYTFEYKEITSHMWKQWYSVYYNVMIKNRMRRNGKRFVSLIIWSLHCNVLFILIFNLMKKNKFTLR